MKGARILVIDDSATILKVVSAMLARSGFVPQTARDGRMGIELIKRGHAFDLVLLDFVMPRMNGYQFCRELRAHAPSKDLPVVLMSAKADKIREQFAQQTGGRTFFPLHRTDLAGVYGHIAKELSSQYRLGYMA